MSSLEQIGTFEAAVIAFEIQLERKLISRWENCEWDAALAILHATAVRKDRLLKQFFHAAEDLIAAAIHEFFPMLLKVATMQREHIADRSPLAWTTAEILTQVCNFLGMDESFDETSEPRDDSRVLAAAHRICNEGGWFPAESHTEFLAPSWVNRGTFSRLLGGEYPTLRSENDTETLSRAGTLTWVKQKEFWISRRLTGQIENESWDAVIEAGKTNLSVLRPFVAEAVQACANNQPETTLSGTQNKFVKDGGTWAIVFSEEKCRLPHMIGLDYISALLGNAGKPMRALELQHTVGGLPMAARPTAKCAKTSLEDAVAGESDSDEGDYRSIVRSDFSREEILDDTGRRNLTNRLRQIEGESTYALEIGDPSKAAELDKEYAEIEVELSRGRNIHGRPRVFSDENEKARTSITKALGRAYEKIRLQAPKTAEHLESQIRTGSEFVYRDSASPWNL